MHNILILTEAGGSIGYGHVTRCLAIAQALKGEAKLILASPHGMPTGVDSDVLNWIGNPAEVIKVNSGSWPNIILVDSYNVDENCIKYLYNKVNYLAVLDDYNRMLYPCDLLINPSIAGPNYAHQRAKIVRGPKFIILRDEIRMCRQKQIHGDLNNLLVTFGGADTGSMLNVVLPMLQDLNFNIHVLTGDDLKATTLRSKFRSHNFNILGRLNSFEVSKLFINVDLALSAGGQTLNELAFLGVPFIAVETGMDQYWNIDGFVQNRVTGRHFFAKEQQLEKLLMAEVDRMRNVLLRAEASQLGKGIVDGLGAIRIANLLNHYGNLRSRCH
jgi:UDP-2,4-diacetamido-2,4,6-trideoxy-beta-L-altropyranose hydrolase